MTKQIRKFEDSPKTLKPLKTRLYIIHYNLVKNKFLAEVTVHSLNIGSINLIMDNFLPIF